MSAHYDKLLLGLAGIVLAGGVAFSFTMSSEDGDITRDITPEDLTGAPFEPLQPPSVSYTHTQWEEPPYQAPEDKAWRYGVFTPPKIYMDPKTGKLEEVPPEPPIPPPPFGLKLVSMAHPVYPITFEAYFDGGTGSVADASLMLYHTGLGKSSGIVGVGDTIEDWNIRVVDLDVEKTGDATSGIETIATVTIKDEKLGKVFSFSPGEIVELEDQNIITVKPSDPPGSSHVWSEAGDTLRHSGSTYTLMQIDFDKRTITVKKESPVLEEPVTLTLIEKSAPVTKPTAQGTSESTPTAEPSQPSQPNTVDDFFNNVQ